MLTGPRRCRGKSIRCEYIVVYIFKNTFYLEMTHCPSDDPVNNVCSGAFTFKLCCVVSANTSTQLLFGVATVHAYLLNFDIDGCFRALSSSRGTIIYIIVTYELYVRFEIPLYFQLC